MPECRRINISDGLGWASRQSSLDNLKGRVMDRFYFSIEGPLIPTVSEKQLKSLGKVFDSSLKDSASVQSTCQELGSWLSAVNQSGLPVPISTAETLERKVSSFHGRRSATGRAQEGCRDPGDRPGLAALSGS